jgi:hypothetical protein
MPTVALKKPKKLRVRRAAKATVKKNPTLWDRMKHLVGTIDGPGDLSTNPKYMEGYGRSRRP